MFIVQAHWLTPGQMIICNLADVSYFTDEFNILIVVLLLRQIVLLFDRNITLVLPWYLMSQ